MRGVVGLVTCAALFILGGGLLMWLGPRRMSWVVVPTTVFAAAVTWLGSLLLARLRVEPFCALCGAPRARVTNLVDGEHGSVCERCVVDAHAVLVPPPSAFDRLRTVVEALPRTTPCSRTTPLLETLADLGGDDELATVAELAANALDYDAGLAILERLAAERRTRDHEFLRAALLYECGRRDEAAQALAAISTDGLPDLGLAMYRQNRALFLLGDGARGPSLDEAAVMIEQSVQTLETIVASGTNHKGPLSRALGVLASVRLAQDRLDEAQQALARADQMWIPSVVRLRTLGEIRHRMGDLDGAREIWQRALALAPSDSRDARALAARLTSGEGPGARNG